MKFSLRFLFAFALTIAVSTTFVATTFAETKPDDETSTALADTETDDEADEEKTDVEAKSAKSKTDDDKSDDEKDVEKKPRLRQISLSGNYVDLVQPLTFNPTSLLMGVNPTKQKSFYHVCKFIDDLADDERFDYVVFDLSAADLSMNGAQLDELSRYMRKLSDAGKKTFAWLENASNVQLSIAANCDEVFIADFGGIDMPSMAMQSMFYRDAMDLVGVKASVVRAGDFKGAVEPYINAEMSEHLREHYRDMLTSMNSAMVDRIARGRGLKSADVRELQTKRILLPNEALAERLVDHLAPFGSMREAIMEQIDDVYDDDVEWVTAKAAAKKDVSLFQLMGQMMAGPSSTSGRLRPDSICVLHLQGAIVDGKKTSAGNIVSGPTVELIEKLVDEDKVKGVVVRINSPGGSATASEAIRQALVKLAREKPVVVSMGNVAASGGYWISCIDAPVYAERSTLTGSIGVFSMKLSAGALLRRVGVRLETIALDDSAELFSLDRAWSDGDTAALQGTIDLVYERFLDLVSDARNIKLKKLKTLAGGRVWSGDQAKQNKLIDFIGGVDDCLTLVAKKTKLDDYNVIHRPVPQSGLDLSELFGSGSEEEIGFGVSAGLRLLQQRGISLQLTRMLLNDGLTNRGKPTVWLLNPFELSIQ